MILLKTLSLKVFRPGCELPRSRYSPLMADTDGVDVILQQWQRERPDLDTSPIGVIGRISRLSREIEAPA